MVKNFYIEIFSKGKFLDREEEEPEEREESRNKGGFQAFGGRGVTIG